MDATEQASEASRYGLGDEERMEHAKFANGNRHLFFDQARSGKAEKDQKDAARSNGKTALRKKTEPANITPRQPQRKKTGAS